MNYIHVLITQMNGKRQEQSHTPIFPQIRQYSSRIFCLFCLSSSRYALSSFSFIELAGNFVPTRKQERSYCLMNSTIGYYKQEIFIKHSGTHYKSSNKNIKSWHICSINVLGLGIYAANLLKGITVAGWLMWMMQIFFPPEFCNAHIKIDLLYFTMSPSATYNISSITIQR